MFENFNFDSFTKFFDIDGIAALIGVPSKYVYIGAAVIVIAALIAVFRKAVKVGVILFVIGFLFVAIGPFLQTTLLNSNGIQYHDKQLTLTVDGEQKTFDFNLIQSYETEKEGETTKITVYLKDGSNQSITVPTKVAEWAVRIMKVGGKIVEAGGNAAKQLEPQPAS